MRSILLSVLFCSIMMVAKSQSTEDRIKNYLLGFEKKDWDMVANQFADGFTFTSPAGDDHISLAQFKEKCWPTSKFFKKVEFKKIVIEGNTAFTVYEITTTDNKIVRNVEYDIFSDGKIKTMECFFGAGIGYPGNTK